MKIELNFKKGYCKVIKESSDPRFTRSAWSEPESTFLYHVKQELIKLGYNVIKKRMWRDGHIVDDTQQYIRTKNYMKCPANTPGEFCILNNRYSLEDAGEEFNKTGEYTLDIFWS